MRLITLMSIKNYTSRKYLNNIFSSGRFCLVQAGEEEAAGVVPVAEAPDQGVQRVPDQPVPGAGRPAAPGDAAAQPDVRGQPAQPHVRGQRHRPPAPHTDGEQRPRNALLGDQADI